MPGAEPLFDLFHISFFSEVGGLNYHVHFLMASLTYV